MNRSAVSFFLGLAAGIVIGIGGWHFLAGRRLDSENQRLRAVATEAEARAAENERLSGERADPDEMKRLREGQTELLRLRGQVAQLRREAQEAKAAADRATVALRTNSLANRDPEIGESPVVSFTNQVSARVGWQQTLVAGGWRLPSGNRAFVFLKPEPGPQEDAVQVEARIVEMPEASASRLGLGEIGLEGGAKATGVLTADQAARMAEGLSQSAGINVIATPRLIAPSGREAQIASVELHHLPDGRQYQTGPVINLLPTITDDRQAVDLSVDAQLHLRRKTP